MFSAPHTYEEANTLFNMYGTKIMLFFELTKQINLFITYNFFLV